MGRQTASVPGKPAFKAKQVGDLVKDERERNNWTQAELARQVGCAKQVISNIERGSVAASVNTLAALAHALGLTIHDVINVGFSHLTVEDQELPVAAGLGRLRG